MRPKHVGPKPGELQAENVAAELAHIASAGAPHMDELRALVATIINLARPRSFTVAYPDGAEVPTAIFEFTSEGDPLVEWRLQCTYREGAEGPEVDVCMRTPSTTFPYSRVTLVTYGHASATVAGPEGSGHNTETVTLADASRLAAGYVHATLQPWSAG